MFRQLIWAGSMALMISACASTGSVAYGPAANGGGYGYQQMQIDQDRYRVSFTGKDTQEVENYVLLRAAELSLQNGYDHFQVVNGHVSGSVGHSPVLYPSVGVGISSSGVHPSVGVGINLGAIGRTEDERGITDTIEIKMLHGSSGAPNVYDAALIKNSMQP